MRAVDFAPVRFSTDDLPERDRLPQWREEFGRGLVRVDIEPASPDLPFRAQAVLQALPGVRTATCRGSDAHFTRTRAMAAEGDDSVGLVVNFGRKALVSQYGENALLAAGDAVPIFTEAPALLTSEHHLGILFPRTALASRVDNLEAAATVVVPRASQPLRLLVRYISLVRKEATLESATLRQTVVDHIYDLAALALGANRDTQETSMSAVAAARLAAAQADIAASFTDQGLTLAAVARRQGVSPRYLQRLLETAGSSFTAEVNELRLQRAFKLLTKSGADRRRIIDIALEAGFSDISHFNRLFRRRFGDSPSGVRGDGATRQ
jgi:AraC-like DNA-binding protein